jgi:hypothetical protein
MHPNKAPANKVPARQWLDTKGTLDVPFVVEVLR